MKVEKIGFFLDGVIRNTRKGNIPWKGTAEDGVYSAVVGEGQYILKSYGFTDYLGDGSPEGPPTLAIFDNQNKIILDISVKLPDVRQAVLSEIHDLASSRAAGADDAIDIILQSFDK